MFYAGYVKWLKKHQKSKEKSFLTQYTKLHTYRFIQVEGRQSLDFLNYFSKNVFFLTLCYNKLAKENLNILKINLHRIKAKACLPRSSRSSRGEQLGAAIGTSIPDLLFLNKFIVLLALSQKVPPLFCEIN